MTAVTPYPELDGLLDEIVGRARAVLGVGFVGAYLQGSFAVGDADLHSDCDFLVVHRDRLTPVQESAIRELHDEIPDPRRSLDPPPRRVLVAGRGRADARRARPRLVVRRPRPACHVMVDALQHRGGPLVAAERGVVMAGPDPSTFVAPVPPEMM